MRSTLLHVVAATLLAGSALAQAPPATSFAVSLDDGSSVSGTPTALSTTTAPRVLRVDATPGGSRELALGHVLGVHGGPPLPPTGAVVHLVGGDELVGTVAAGDAAGETFVLRSPSLGDVRVSIDRLDRIVFLARAAGAGPEAFAVPDDASSDELLFRPAARGFDSDVGAIYRFLDDAVVFAIGDGEPKPRPFESLAAIALRGGVPRAKPPQATLLTRTGDRVGVDVTGIENGTMTVVLEGDRPARVALADVAALSFAASGRTFLSDMKPARVEEHSWFADGDGPLMPFRTDRAVSGSALVAGGHAFVRGLGVHSFSSLTFRVPDGAHHFLTRVAIDDDVLDLDVRGIAKVVVTHADEKAFEGEVKSGADPLLVGPFDVTPGKLLTLTADFGPGLDLGDRVDWLEAVFLP